MVTDVDVEHVDVGVPADLVAQHGPFMLTKTSARATRDATFEEWEAATKWAQDVEKASPFWIGDLLAYGEHKYGEMYSQAMDVTSSSYGTLANAAYVAGRVESSRRRENLPFSHHQEVAPLPPAEQDAWLDKCETDGLTREQLRHRIKAARAEAAPAWPARALAWSIPDLLGQTPVAPAAAPTTTAAPADARTETTMAGEA